MSHWRDRPEGGSRFWLVLIRWIILNVGRGFARFCMVPTALYFYLVRDVERCASRRWLELVEAPRWGFIGVITHIYTYAITIVDRVLLLAGREDELDIRAEGVDELVDVLRKGNGALLLGSHLGSFEAIRVFSRTAPPECRYLKVVMDRQQNSRITRILEELNTDIRDTVIDARQPGPQIILQAYDALSEGAMVAMLADRTYRSEAAVRVPFVGETAQLPVAPLGFAAALDAPVFLVFGLYEGKRRYRLVFEPLPRPGPRPTTRRDRRAQLNQWVAAYSQRLEHYAREYPYNWFNFYDFSAADLPADVQPSGSKSDDRA